MSFSLLIFRQKSVEKNEVVRGNARISNELQFRFSFRRTDYAHREFASALYVPFRRRITRLKLTELPLAYIITIVIGKQKFRFSVKCQSLANVNIFTVAAM